MPILLTEQQWADVQQGTELPVRVQDPMQGATFVLLRAEVYDRFKSLFEEDAIRNDRKITSLFGYSILKLRLPSPRYSGERGRG